MRDCKIAWKKNKLKEILTRGEVALGPCVYSFGPADYSFSIGVRGQTSHPKVMDGLKGILEAAKKHGKAVCMGVGYPWAENAKKFIAMGRRLIEFGHDVTILQTRGREWWQRYGSRCKAKTGRQGGVSPRAAITPSPR